MSRSIPHRYEDPLDAIWLRCAAELGWKLERSETVFASWDGTDTLTICTDDHFDADDSMAQYIFHEICHSLVQGRGSPRKLDWGLAIDGDTSAREEYGCHRLQAALADMYGLRGLLAPTTDWRPYWDDLPEDPLADVKDDAVKRARAAWSDAMRGPLSGPLHKALKATAAMAQIVRPVADDGSLWAHTKALHPTGVAMGPKHTSCGSCTWLQQGHCMVHAEEGEDGPAVPATTPACLFWQGRLTDDDCLSCGACCREGFGAVGVSDDDDFMDRHPELVTFDGGFAYIDRPNGLCKALCPSNGEWPCKVYATRPTSCREFASSSESCLIARRRVGLERPR